MVGDDDGNSILVVGGDPVALLTAYCLARLGIACVLSCLQIGYLKGRMFPLYSANHGISPDARAAG